MDMFFLKKEQKDKPQRKRETANSDFAVSRQRLILYIFGDGCAYLALNPIYLHLRFDQKQPSSVHATQARASMDSSLFFYGCVGNFPFSLS